MKKYVNVQSNYQSDISEEVTKEEIAELLEEKADEVLGYFQDKMGITSGDVFPDDLFEYEELIRQLSECMLGILHGQLPYDEDEDDDEDWRYK